MTDEARELHNQYQREYRKAHPEKVRQYYETYWMRRAAKAEQKPERGLIHENKCSSCITFF